MGTTSGTRARHAAKHLSALAGRVRRPRPGLTVLLYHRVGAGITSQVDLPQPLFDEQMAWLAANTTVVSLADGLQLLAGDGERPAGEHPAGGPGDRAHRSGEGRPTVAITFDDGTADFVDNAVPVLARHGLPATLYVATDWVERAEPFWGNGAALTWGALAEALDTGVVSVGSHTHTHRLLDRLEPAEIGDELDRSIELIGEHLGVSAHDFAYPKALPPSPAAEAAVRARFRSAALAGTRPNPWGATDPHRLARSPVQVADAMAWFTAKAGGDMWFEDWSRDRLNRLRYRGASR